MSICRDDDAIKRAHVVFASVIVQIVAPSLALYLPFSLSSLLSARIHQVDPLREKIHRCVPIGTIAYCIEGESECPFELVAVRDNICRNLNQE